MSSYGCVSGERAASSAHFASATRPGTIASRLLVKQRLLEQWSQGVGASDTSVKEASLRPGSLAAIPPPIKGRWDSSPGFSGPQG